MEKLLSDVQAYFTINRIFIILIIITLTLLLFEILSVIKGHNIFSPTLKEKIEYKNQKARFRKGLVDKYKDLVYFIIKTKKKKGWYVNDSFKKEDIEIVLERTQQKLTSDSMDFMTEDEWSAVNFLWSVLFLIIGFLSFIFFKVNIRTPILIIVILCLLYVNWFHYLMLKQVVLSQNETIIKYFGDFYLKQHHILMVEHKNPLTKGLNIYKRVCKNEYMSSWTTITLQMIKQTSEEYVVKRYQTLYRDIPVLCHLLQIEEAIIQGGDVTLQLQGIRASIIEQKKLDIERNSQKKVMHAYITIYLVSIVVIQACIGFIIWSVTNGALKNW